MPLRSFLFTRVLLFIFRWINKSRQLYLIVVVVQFRQSILYRGVYWLHTCIWSKRHMIEGSTHWNQRSFGFNHQRLVDIVPYAQLKSSSIKAKETCLSSRKCIARRPHHTSLAAECLLCFGSQTCPDVETDSSQMYVSLVSLSLEAWTQTDVSARCYRRAIREIYLLKRRWTTLLSCVACYCGATVFSQLLVTVNTV